MMSLTAAYDGDAGLIHGNKRFLIGVGVSVTVHILFMLAYRSTGPSLPAVEPESPSSITVRIAPPPPPEPPRLEPAVPQRSVPAAPRSNARRSPPQAVIAVPASPPQEAAPDPFTVQQADEPAPAPVQDDAPQFDLNSARQTARQLAGQTKLGSEGRANAQFPDPPLETETKLGKAISKAKRRHCKDGIPGGLLAPLVLLMDKKDHGCKW